MGFEAVPNLGATLGPDGSCEFLVWAPRARRVDLHIVPPSDECVVAMKCEDGGYFRARLEDIQHGTRYFYHIDGVRDRPDPASRFQPEGVHGPSQVVDSQFDWSDGAWCGVELADYVLYELHVGTFTPQGTFEAIIPRLASLKDLGITALELMPVAQFPGSRNWGYDGAFPFAVQESYGGPLGLKRLVDASHRMGLAVVLDVVYNHLGPEGNYLAEFAPYFTDCYRTPWGQALNFDRTQSDEVRRYFVENALQWIDEFHIDALRLDAVHAIADTSARPFLAELATAVCAAAQRLRRNVYLMPESNQNDARLVAPQADHGCGLDAVWNDDFHHSVHVLLTNERDGYYADFGTTTQLARAFSEGFIYSGQFSKYRGRRHGNSSSGIPAERFVVFAQNHDQVGNRRLGDRLSSIVPFEALKLAAGLVILSPFLPLFFMGEEYAEIAPFQYFVSHGDAALIEAVRNGRREEFSRFSWQGELPDPQDEATFARSRLHWELREQPSHRPLVAFYKELLRLRREDLVLSRRDKDHLEAVPFESPRVLFLRRWHEEHQILAYFNFEREPATQICPVPTGSWETLLDSADPAWGGPGSETPARLNSTGNATISLPPFAVAVFGKTEEVR